MNTPKQYSLQAARLALFLLSSAAALAGSAPADRLAHYYESPQPTAIGDLAADLSRDGYFDQAAHRATAIGFFAGAFAQNPDRVSEWLSSFEKLPVQHRRLMAAALWYSGLPAGREHLLATARETSSPAMRADIEQLVAQNERALAQTPVRSESSLNLQWGAFLATGESQHVLQILSALGSAEPALNTAARYTLAQQAATHPRVLEICRVELSRAPNALNETLRAVLKESAAIQHPSS